MYFSLPEVYAPLHLGLYSVFVDFHCYSLLSVHRILPSTRNMPMNSKLNIGKKDLINNSIGCRKIHCSFLGENEDPKIANVLVLCLLRYQLNKTEVIKSNLILSVFHLSLI